MLTAPDKGSERRSALADLGVKSAIAGFGLSAGRGAFRKLSQDWLALAIAAAVLFGSGYGVWNLLRGHPTSSPMLSRALAALMLSLVGTAISFGLVAMFSGSLPAAIITTAIVQLTSGLVGGLVGASQRKGRLRQFSIADHNQRFLASEGLVEVGGVDGTIVDRRGNEFVVDDWRRDRIMLRRTKGAGTGHIILDDEGRMLSYTPPGKSRGPRSTATSVN